MAPSRSARVLASLAIGILSAIAIVLVDQRIPGLRTDFDQIWFAAKSVLEGRNPYPLIGQGREFWYGWPMFYPLTAPVSVVPLGLLPLLWARVIFGAGTGALLAYLVTRDGWYRLTLFLAPAYLLHLMWLQWSVLLTCALFLPALGWFGASKPNIGLVSFVAQRKPRQAILFALAGLIPLLASLLIQPSWPGEWIAIMHQWDYGTPTVLLPGGALLLVALLRWHRWEGRLYLTLLCVPQTPGAISALPLLLIPKTWRGMLVLSILSFGAHATVPLVLELGPSFVPKLREASRMTMWSCFVPALYYLLRLPRLEDAGSDVAPARDCGGPVVDVERMGR